MTTLNGIASCFVILTLGATLIQMEWGRQTLLGLNHRNTLKTTSYINISTTTITPTGGRSRPNHNKELQGLFESVNAKPPKRIVSDQISNRCPGLKKPSLDLLKPWQGIWHNLSWNRAGEARVQHFYTAVVDDREAAGPTPTLRLLAVGPPLDTHVYCQVWFTRLDHCHVVRATPTKNSNGHNIRDVFYGQYFWSCALADLSDSTIMRIDRVSMVTDLCAQPMNLIPVVIPEKRKKWEFEFGLCVSISYWDIDPVRIAEWVEIHRILGVSEINIYTADIANRTNKILKYYQKFGYVRVNELVSPVAGDEEDMLMLLSAVVLNDCMWRNMYRYRYMVVVDFDEVITPRRNLTYHELLKDIDNSHKFPKPAASYTFRNTYFWVGCEGSTHKHKQVQSYILSHTKREPHNIFLYASKSIINPRQCLSVFNHYCLVHMPHRPEPWTVDVSPQFALSHHYRRTRKGVTCDQVTKNMTITDTVMDRYKVKARTVYLRSQNPGENIYKFSNVVDHTTPDTVQFK